MSQQRQTELNTIIYPLYAARLYLDDVPGTTGHIDVSIINGVKLAFVAHAYRGDVYSTTTASVYAIDFEITMQSIEDALLHKEPVTIELTMSSNYAKVRKESTIVFVRNEAGIWAVNIRATDKPSIKVEFKGIRASSHSVKGVPPDSVTLSARHFKAWLKILENSMAVAAAIHGHSNERVLLPRENMPA